MLYALLQITGNWLAYLSRSLRLAYKVSEEQREYDDNPDEIKEKQRESDDAWYSYCCFCKILD